MAKEDFLSLFIGNQAVARVLRVFAFNIDEILSMADILKRAGVSKAAAEKAIKTLEKMRLVRPGKASIVLSNGTKRRVVGKQRMPTWMANQDFKYMRAVSSFVHEVSPVRYDELVGVIKRTGRVSAVILSGSFMGDASRPADLIVAADPLNERKLAAAVRTLEPTVGREIRYAAFSTPEFRYRLTVQDKLLRDTLDFPHLVLLDRTRLL